MCDVSINLVQFAKFQRRDFDCFTGIAINQAWRWATNAAAFLVALLLSPSMCLR